MTDNKTQSKIKKILIGLSVAIGFIILISFILFIILKYNVNHNNYDDMTSMLRGSFTQDYDDDYMTNMFSRA